MGKEFRGLEGLWKASWFSIWWESLPERPAMGGGGWKPSSDSNFTSSHRDIVRELSKNVTS